MEIHIKYIVYFVFYFCLMIILMFIYHLLKTINRIKGLLESVRHALQIFHYQRHLEICIAKCIYTSLAHCNACLILEKHVRVLFEGNILLNCMALRCPLTFSFSSADDFCPETPLFRQCDPCSGLDLVFNSEKKIFTGFFPLYLSVAHNLGCICEQTITC